MTLSAEHRNRSGRDCGCGVMRSQGTSSSASSAAGSVAIIACMKATSAWSDPANDPDQTSLTPRPPTAS